MAVAVRWPFYIIRFRPAPPVVVTKVSFCTSRPETPKDVCVVPKVQVFVPVAPLVLRAREATPVAMTLVLPETANTLDIPAGAATVVALNAPPNRNPNNVSVVFAADGVIDGEVGDVLVALSEVVAVPSTNPNPQPDHSENVHSPPVELVVQVKAPEKAAVEGACL